MDVQNIEQQTCQKINWSSKHLQNLLTPMNSNRFSSETAAMLFHNAKVLFSFNDFHDALVLLREALNIDSFNVVLLDFFYKTLLKVGQNDEALSVLEANQRIKYSATKSIELAKFYVDSQQNDKALAQLFDVL